MKELATRIQGEWLQLTPGIAHGYMLFLADTVSKRRLIPKITNNRSVFAIMAFFEEEGNFDEWVYDPEREEYYTSIIFPTLLPGGVTRVEIDKVLEFRHETSIIRADFRRNVEKFALELQKIKSKDYAQEIALQLKKNLDAHEKSLVEIAKEKALKLVPSIVSVGVPTALTAIGAFGLSGNPFELKDIMNSVAIGAVSSIADASNKKIWTPASASYYLKLNSRFSDGEKMVLSNPKFYKDFEEFIND